jgi:Uma2 family endonuclease
MEAVTTLPYSRPLTVADLDAMPDDGHRYELIDGALIVTPAPGLRHQRASIRLAVALHDACPEHLMVLAAPFQVTLSEDTGVQPDILVAPRDAFTEKNLPGAPLLAVEILSPSTRLIDLNLKRASYARAGVPSYWIVDPVEPRLLVWELSGEEYVEVADVAGDESWTSQRPFAVTVVPPGLVD